MLGDLISNRGFNALVFTPNATTTHFLKVRPASHEGFRREADWTRQLCRHPASRPFVPEAAAFEEGPARMLVQEFVDGTALDVAIRSRKSPSWHAAAAAALRLARPLWDAISDLSLTPPGNHADLRPLLDDLRLLCGLGLRAEVAASLSAILSRNVLPSFPQHGDFWPRNILASSDGWRIIDFESCGQICLPLYDVFHMVRGCAEATGRGDRSWIEIWNEARSRARPLADAVLQTAGQVSLEQIEAALVAYQVDFAARLHRRGISRERTRGRIRDLDGLPGVIARGEVGRLLS